MNLFGIVDEGEKHYYNYVYTEGYKHGSEHVISMVHAHLRDHCASGEAEHLYVYTDSCGGQNRNKYLYSYLIQRVIAGYHEKVTWCFLAVGHTKFSPDRSFGLIRGCLSKHTVISLPDLLNLINDIGVDAEWKCSGAEVRDEDFRQWKVLFNGSNIEALDGIKIMNIQEIRIRAYDNEDGKRRVRVTVVQVDKTEKVKVCPVREKLRKEEKKAGFTEVPWPTGDEVRSNIPPLLSRKPLSQTRYSALQDIVKKFIGVSEDQKQFYVNLKCVSSAKEVTAIAPTAADLSTIEEAIDAIDVCETPLPQSSTTEPVPASENSPVLSRAEMIAVAATPDSGVKRKSVSRFYRDLEEEELPPRKRSTWKEKIFS